jgi:hypothetical protein
MWRTAKTTTVAFFVAFVGLMSVAQADCWYKGHRYSDGARNDQGQVCDGATGTWK